MEEKVIVKLTKDEVRQLKDRKIRIALGQAFILGSERFASIFPSYAKFLRMEPGEMVVIEHTEEGHLIRYAISGAKGCKPFVLTRAH